MRIEYNGEKHNVIEIRGGPHCGKNVGSEIVKIIFPDIRFNNIKTCMDKIHELKNIIWTELLKSERPVHKVEFLEKSPVLTFQATMRIGKGWIDRRLIKEGVRKMTDPSDQLYCDDYMQCMLERVRKRPGKIR